MQRMSTLLDQILQGGQEKKAAPKPAWRARLWTTLRTRWLYLLFVALLAGAGVAQQTNWQPFRPRTFPRPLSIPANQEAWWAGTWVSDSRFTLDLNANGSGEMTEYRGSLACGRAVQLTEVRGARALMMYHDFAVQFLLVAHAGEITLYRLKGVGNTGKYTLIPLTESRLKIAYYPDDLGHHEKMATLQRSKQASSR